jgi:hypothetical protein
VTPEEFCRWLQGFIELHGKPPTPKQWKAIKEHLQLVYVKVTPPVGATETKPGGLADAIRRLETTTLIC